MGRRTRVALLTLAFVVPALLYNGWERRLQPPIVGDEPHYLVMAQSLVSDRDLELADDYRGTILQLNPMFEPTNAVDMRGEGVLRPIQMPGMGALLAPAVVASRGGASDDLRWARRLMIFVAALLAQQMLALLLDLRPKPAWLAVAVWVPFVLALPVIAYSNQIYPEIPGALVAVIALRLGMRASTNARIALAASVAATLPWLSIRFAPIAVGLAAWLAFKDGIKGDRRTLGRRLAASFVPITMSTAVLGAWFLYAFGTLSLQAVYAQANHDTERSLFLTYVRGLGPYLSPVDGLFALAPFLLLGVVGIGVLWRRHRVGAIVLLATEAAYLLVLGPSGFRGYAPVGRIVVIATPILVVTALLLVHERRVLLPLFGALAALTLVVTAQGSSQPTYGALYAEHGVPISFVRHIENWWPTFTSAPGSDAATIDARDWRPVSLRRARYEVAVNARCVSPPCAVTIDVRQSHDPYTAPHALPPLTEQVGTDNHIVTRRLSIGHSGDIVWLRASADEPARIGPVRIRLASRPEPRHQPVIDDVLVTLAWLAGLGVAAGLAARQPRGNGARLRRLAVAS